MHLRECAEHGARFGVIVAVQNHGDFIRSGEQHLSLLKRVDHEWCAALVDTGKYLTAGSVRGHRPDGAVRGELADQGDARKQRSTRRART